MAQALNEEEERRIRQEADDEEVARALEKEINEVTLTEEEKKRGANKGFIQARMRRGKRRENVFDPDVLETPLLEEAEVDGVSGHAADAVMLPLTQVAPTDDYHGDSHLGDGESVTPATTHVQELFKRKHSGSTPDSSDGEVAPPTREEMLKRELQSAVRRKDKKAQVKIAGEIKRLYESEVKAVQATVQAEKQREQYMWQRRALARRRTLKPVPKKSTKANSKQSARWQKKRDRERERM